MLRLVTDSAETVLLAHGPTPVAWRRSARARRVSLRIDPRSGQVVITLPPRTGRPAGLALLTNHADWVSARLARLPETMPFAPGATVKLAGQPIVIRHMPGGRGGAWLDGSELQVAGAAEFVGRRVTDFLRREAARRLGAIALAKAEAGALRVRRLTIKDTRSRWGSCTADGTLMFNWRLVMAPAFVQDYVVAHEVAHLRHMNHGPKFWALVEELTPHRLAALRWLETGGAGLMRAG